MRYNEIIGESILTEGADLSCRTCGEHLGKATECDNPQYCGTCGDRTPNPHGESSSYAPFASTTRAKPTPAKAALKPTAKPASAQPTAPAAPEDNTPRYSTGQQVFSKMMATAVYRSVGNSRVVIGYYRPDNQRGGFTGFVWDAQAGKPVASRFSKRENLIQKWIISKGGQR